MGVGRFLMGKVPLSSELAAQKSVKAGFWPFNRQVSGNIQGVRASLDTRALHRWVFERGESERQQVTSLGPLERGDKETTGYEPFDR